MRRNNKDYVEAKDRVDLSVGDAIRIACEMNGINQTELAKRAKMHATHISAIVNGRRPIGKDVATRLAKVLHVSPAHILFAGEKPREGNITEEAIDHFVSVLRSQKRDVNGLLSEALKAMRTAQTRDKLTPTFLKRVTEVIVKAREANDIEDITGFYVLAKKSLKESKHKH